MRLILLPIICVALAIIGAVGLPYGLFWLTILPLIGFVSLTVGPCIIAYFWYKRVPSAARILVEAYQRKKPLLLIVHDSGRAILTWIEEKRGEGIVITKEGQYKILPQFSTISKGKEGNPGGDGKDVRYEKEYRDFISKRSILMGLDQPFFVAYSGKMCLLNPEALALYEAGEMTIKDADGKIHGLTRQNETESETVCSKCGKPLEESWDHCPYCKGKKTVVQRIKKTLSNVLQPILLLDPRRIKELIGRQFNPSQIEALMRESYELGLLGKGTLRKYALPIAFILMAVVIGAIIFMMAPQLMSGFGGGA